MSHGAQMRVSRATLVKRLRDRVGLGHNDASACLETILSLMQRSLVMGDDVRIIGFGQFTLHERAARTAIHPATGKAVDVRARRVVQFRPSRALKALIDQTSRPAGVEVDSDSH